MTAPTHSYTAASCGCCECDSCSATEPVSLGDAIYGLFPADETATSAPRRPNEQSEERRTYLTLNVAEQGPAHPQDPDAYSADKTGGTGPDSEEKDSAGEENGQSLRTLKDAIAEAEEKVADDGQGPGLDLDGDHLADHDITTEEARIGSGIVFVCAKDGCDARTRVRVDLNDIPCGGEK